MATLIEFHAKRCNGCVDCVDYKYEAWVDDLHDSMYPEPWDDVERDPWFIIAELRRELADAHEAISELEFLQSQDRHYIRELIAVNSQYASLLGIPF